MDARELSRAFEPLPPHHTEAEQAVLRILLTDWSAGIEIDFLRPDDFYHPKHRLIYEAILRCVERGAPPDYLIVCDELERVRQLEDVGGDVYVAKLLSAYASPFLIEHYARLVWRAAIYRRLIKIAGEIAALAWDDSAAVAATLAQAESLLLTVTRNVARRPPPRSVLETYATGRANGHHVPA